MLKKILLFILLTSSVCANLYNKFDYNYWVTYYSNLYDVDRLASIALGDTESDFTSVPGDLTQALSKRTYGIYQLSLATAKGDAIDLCIDPNTITPAELIKNTTLNIQLGIYHVSKMLYRYHSYHKAFMVYNAGERGMKLGHGLKYARKVERKWHRLALHYKSR